MAPKEEQPSLLAVGFEQITFYDGQEQVDLAVEIEVPGSWFGGTAAGTLNATERREKFKAQAVEYAAVHEFPAVGRGIKKTKEKGIRFLCIEDAADDPHSVGYWMRLSQWNRYRHDTYKDRQDAELPYIKERPSNETVAFAAPPTKEPKIKTVFEKKGTGMHKQGDGQNVPCTFWECKQPKCKKKGETIKEIRAGTGQLFRHLKTCNNALWRELRLDSKHSKARRDESASISPYVSK